MLDLACPKDTNISLKLASLVEEFRPYWFEEPVDGEATRALKDIREKTKDESESILEQTNKR